MRTSRFFPATHRWRGWGGLFLLAALAGAVAPLSGVAADGAAPEPARLQVDGLGLWRNHEVEGTLRLLLGGERGPTMDANALEDAAMIVFSSLSQEGYLDPVIAIEVTQAGGKKESYELDPKLDHPLPRPLETSGATLHIRPGQRYTIADVTFTGLTALRESEARNFFRGENALFSLGADRAYSPARLARSEGNLLEELRHRGYAEARVELGDVSLDHATGAVSVPVRVQEGARWRVSTVRLEPADGSEAPPGLGTSLIGRPWSNLWRQDMETAIRLWYYQRGHPDVQVSLTPQAAEEAGGERAVTVTADIRPGATVTLGQVRFAGNEHTRESVLRPLVPLKEGALLNPAEMQNSQFRISHLGVFSSVDLRYEPATGPVRDAVYQLIEGRRREASLLFGYGSYEQVRGGIELRDYNLFGRAHQGTLELVQSMKGTRGEYNYTVPELFGSSVDGTARLFGLRREEPSYLRQEYGASVTAAWPLRRLGLDMTTGYTFERLRNTNSSLATSTVDLTETNAASLNLGLTRDRRDNPLMPRHGYKAFLQLDEASRRLGGQVDYQRLQLGFSYHTAWGASRWIHVGFTHGVVTTLGSLNDSQLPASVRFYPGGDNSIRGYSESEAAPRAADGQFLGAKSTMLLNLELEQAVTSKWSLVVFSDSLGMAARMAHYPFDQQLYSVGLGLRYQTIIGPVRLEYGRNLNPRPLDVGGTLLFSLGFPF